MRWEGRGRRQEPGKKSGRKDRGAVEGGCLEKTGREVG